MTPNQLPPPPAIDPVLGHPEHHMHWTRLEIAWIQKYATDYALAALAQQEPVAWLYVDTVGERYLCFSRPTGGGTITNLYTPPPAPQAPGRRKGPPGITLEPQSHEQTGDNFSATPKMVQTPHDIDALIDRVSGAICLSHSAWDMADARVLVLEILKQAGPLYTTPPAPQPAPVDELPDLNPEDVAVDVVLKQLGGFAPVTTHGVRVTHKPSRVSVVVDSERSQHRNRQLALEALRATIHHQANPVPAPVDEREAWLPIESAPKDGTRLILWWGGKPVFAGWLDNSQCKHPWAGWQTPSLTPRPQGEPTHYMLLPSAPQTKGQP